MIINLENAHYDLAVILTTLFSVGKKRVLDVLMQIPIPFFMRTTVIRRLSELIISGGLQKRYWESCDLFTVLKSE